MCGDESWVELEFYGKAQEIWLKEFLELGNVILSAERFNNA